MPNTSSPLSRAEKSLIWGLIGSIKIAREPLKMKLSKRSISQRMILEFRIHQRLKIWRWKQTRWAGITRTIRSFIHLIIQILLQRKLSPRIFRLEKSSRSRSKKTSSQGSSSKCHHPRNISLLKMIWRYLRLTRWWTPQLALTWCTLLESEEMLITEQCPLEMRKL